MKIAILGSAFPFRGGLASYNERLALAFQEAGHEVTIYTFTTQYPSLLFPGKSQYSDESPPKNLKIVRILSSINPFSWWETGKTIKKGNYDILIIKFWLPFMGPAFGTTARIVKKNNNTSRISILDNVIPHEKRLGDRLFTSYFINAMQGFIAMSRQVYQDLSSFDDKKPRILSPHPLFDNFGEKLSKEEAQKHLGLSPDVHYMLFFGFVRKYKGLDLLIEAMNDPKFDQMNIKLIIAGEYYDQKSTYTDLIEKYQLQNRIILYDQFITDSEVKYFFSASDLIIQPYKSATQSGVTQIAYHFDKPMIVTDVGGLSELCPDGIVGYVVPVDPIAIREAIFKFYDEHREEEMVKNIKIEKKKYGWDILVQNILKLRQTLLDE